jgi:hypothetical protein
MKRFVYRVQDGRVQFHTGSLRAGEAWGDDPAYAYDWLCSWVEAEPTPEMPNRTKKLVNEGEVYARRYACHYCIGDPNDLLALHQKGPRIGQRVRVRRVRSDGHAYGTGTVVGYAEFLPHFLTHTVLLDEPPEAGAPDEFGNVLTRDPEVLARHHCPAHELEAI